MQPDNLPHRPSVRRQEVHNEHRPKVMQTDFTHDDDIRIEDPDDGSMGINEKK